MTSDEKAFLTTIQNNRADRTARLVYADWLDEQDGRSVHAALQRVLAQPESDEMRLAYADALDPPKTGHPRADFIRLDCNLFKKHDRRWSVHSPAALSEPVPATDERFCCWLHDEFAFQWIKEEVPFLLDAEQMNSTVIPYWEWEWQRGFIHQVSTDWDRWFARAGDLLDAHPVQRLMLWSLPQVQFARDRAHKRVHARVVGLKPILHISEHFINMARYQTEWEIIWRILKHTYPSLTHVNHANLILPHRLTWDYVRDMLDADFQAEMNRSGKTLMEVLDAE